MKGKCSNWFIEITREEASNYNTKKKDYEFLSSLSKASLPVSKAIEFGMCEEGQSVYMLLEWMEGEEAEKVLPEMSMDKQYLLGVKAGKVLRGIHENACIKSVKQDWYDKMKQVIPTWYREYKGETFMQVQFGKNTDIDEWMKLVEEISWNFPGLETKEKIDEHRETVLRFISKEQALCVKDNDKEVVGVLLFSRGHNMICCLGVSPKYRRHGIASMLLSMALEQLDRTKDITVSTFREEDSKGTAPRALYRKFGFVEGELIEEFGYPNQRFILHPSCL